MGEWPTTAQLTGTPVYVEEDVRGCWHHQNFIEGLSLEVCRNKPYPHFDMDAACFDALKEKLGETVKEIT